MKTQKTKPKSKTHDAKKPDAKKPGWGDVSAPDGGTPCCPTCGAKTDRWSAVGKDGVSAPCAGDPSICIYCMELAVFDHVDGREGVYLRRPTEAESMDILTDRGWVEVHEQMTIMHMLMVEDGALPSPCPHCDALRKSVGEDTWARLVQMVDRLRSLRDAASARKNEEMAAVFVDKEGRRIEDADDVMDGPPGPAPAPYDRLDTMAEALRKLHHDMYLDPGGDDDPAKFQLRPVVFAVAASGGLVPIMIDPRAMGDDDSWKNGFVRAVRSALKRMRAERYAVVVESWMASPPARREGGGLRSTSSVRARGSHGGAGDHAGGPRRASDHDRRRARARHDHRAGDGVPGGVPGRHRRP